MKNLSTTDSYGLFFQFQQQFSSKFGAARRAKLDICRRSFRTTTTAKLNNNNNKTKTNN